jgi:hypothetical protein
LVHAKSIVSDVQLYSDYGHNQKPTPANSSAHKHKAAIAVGAMLARHSQPKL